MLPRRIERLLWRLLGMLFVALMYSESSFGRPHAHFLLPAAWAAGGGGWPALELWLLRHLRHREPIRECHSGSMV